MIFNGGVELPATRSGFWSMIPVDIFQFVRFVKSMQHNWNELDSIGVFRSFALYSPCNASDG